MRVLHTIGEMGTGGAEALVVEMVTRGPEVGWESSVASAGGRREDELVGDGLARAHRVPLSRRRPLGLLQALRATRRALLESEPDVVIAHNVGVSFATWLALHSLRRRHIPMVTVFHGVAENDYRASASLLSRAPDAVVTVSETIMERLGRAGLHARTTRVIPNAVSPAPLPPRDQARAELGLAEDVPVALCAARLVDQKRQDLLLEAWRLVPEPAVLLLAGDGPNRARLEAQIAATGLTGRVQMLGTRSDVPRLLAAADLTTLSSDWEGLPVAVLESMAAGRPVVSTDVDGVAEVLSHGGGLMVPRRDPAALAKALTELLGDPSRARKLGDEARQVITERHDPRQMMRSYDQLLRELLTRRTTNP